MQAPLSRDLFALDPNLTYLNHAAIGVLPIAARDAIVAFAHAHAERGVLGTAAYEARLVQSRQRLARCVGAGSGDIAFLGNTSQAANILARGITWRRGDEIVINDNEFGSNALPWLALREIGVVVRMVRTQHERMTPDVLRGYMNTRTRLVATSWVSFVDGYRHDLAALAQVAHEGGAYFAVDAIQGLGAFAIDMHGAHIDAVFGGAQKWLMSQPGLGYLCVRGKLSEELEVRLPGWRSLNNLWDFLNYEQPLLPGIDRFEGGTPNLLGIAALDASLDVLETAPASQRESYIVGLTDYLVQELQRFDARLITLRGEGISSGIVTFMLPNVDPLETGKYLAEAGVVVTARPTGIRVSPHAYSTTADIDRLIQNLGLQGASIDN